MATKPQKSGLPTAPAPAQQTSQQIPPPPGGGSWKWDGSKWQPKVAPAAKEIAAT